MAETLRELVVSLSLRSDNFSQNIKTVQNQIKEAESRFKAAGAGIDDFGRKTEGLKAKASALADTLRLQGQIVDQYQRALNQANATLQRNSQTQQELTGKLDAARAKYTSLKTQIEQTRTALQKNIKAEGDNSEESIRLGLALQELEDEYKTTGTEIKKLESQLTGQNKTLQRNANEVTNVTTALNTAKAAEAATKAELDKTNRAIETHRARWEAAAASMDKFGKRAMIAGQNMTRLGQSLTTYVSAPLLALGGYAVKASIDAESAFAEVRKTVDMTEEQFAQLDQQIQDMTVYKPSDKSGYDQITDIAAAAGQFDVANKYLKDFTGTVVDLGVATDIAGREGATQLAQYAAVTNMAQENFGRFGSTLVELGNTTKTTESAIMAMSTKIGSAGHMVGLTDAQILGFSAGLSSVGLEAEAGGSAFSKAIIGMQLAVETGKNGLKDYAKVAGMSSTEFQKAWKTDAAGAIQEFIVGLSKMNESGVSTIKTLNDMGFTEVRLRDTLMRAANANVLFQSAQTSASAAWKENTALSEEAGKRYGTDKNRLIGLKAEVQNLARTYGNDLNPALDDLIDTADGWLDSLGKMDAGQRQTMLSTAAWIAGIGPGIMIIGKLNTAFGSLATGMSGLIKTSVEAGGGLKGLFAATGSLLGPAGIAVLAGAALYGAYAWADYASGAKAAREASEAMQKTAESWKNTQATTIFDTGNDPLARFGLSKESFTGGQTELEDWMGRLSATWSDGKKETNEIVKGYVDEFKTGSDKIREAIKARKKTQEKFGVVDDKTTAEDLKKLDKYDKEVAALLKKKRNGKLSEKDQTTLNQLIQERVEIQLKYTTGEGGGYDSLTQAVEAEKARLKLDGDKGGETTALYGDTLKGAAQGYQAQVDAINQSYTDQYADIQAITDEKEREAALTQLNLEHTQALKKAQEEYNAVVGKYAPEAFQTPAVQQAQKDMADLQQKIADFQTGKIDATELKAFTDSLDEGKLASYVTLLKQMQESGLGDFKLGGTDEKPITPESLLGGYSTVADYLKANAGTLTGLGDMLGAASDEANRVLIDMGLTPEGQTLKDWLDAHAEFSLTGKLEGLPESVTIDATAPVTLTNLPESVTVDADAPVTLMGLPETITIDATAPTTLTGLPETITIDATAPTTLTGLPDSIVVDASSPVTLTNVPESLIIDADAPVTITGLPEGPLTIPANSPTTLTGLPDGITIEAEAPVTLSGVPESLTVEADAPVTLSGVPDSLTVDADAPVTLSGVPDSLTVNAEAPVTLTGVPGSLTVQATAPVTLSGLPESVSIPEGVIQSVKVADGVVLSVPATITPTPFEPGTPKSVEFAQSKMDQKPNNVLTNAGLTTSAQNDVDTITNLVTEINNLNAAIATLKASGEVYDESGFTEYDLEEKKAAAIGLLKDNLNNLSETDLSSITINIKALMDALASGTLTPEDATALQTQLNAMLAVVQAADQYLGVGNDISAGIASGMKAYGWSGDATTLAASIESAMRVATGSHSPATKFVPVGVDIAAGVAKGVEDGTYKVENAMVKLAKAALKAAKNAMVIESPSHVMRDEVGVMIPRGVVVGIEEETVRQQRAVQNAFRSLVQPALDGSRAGVVNNKRTTSYHSSVSLSGANIYLADRLDAEALSYQLAGVNIAQLRALGVNTRG